MCGEVANIPNALHMLFVAKSSDSNKLDDDSVNNDHVGSGPNSNFDMSPKNFPPIGCYGWWGERM